MLEIYTLPHVRLNALANTLGAALGAVLTDDDIPVELGELLAGILSISRAEAMRLSDELDPTVVTISPLPRIAPVAPAGTTENN